MDEVSVMEKKQDRESRACIGGVCCQVESCRHHTRGGQCTAPHIDVKSESALTKAETFCGTYAPVDTWHFA